MTLKISVYLVNGGMQEWKESNSFHQKLLLLQKRGLSGKQLIHELLTDDWGVPPSTIKIQGKLSSGLSVDESLFYD